MDPIDELFWLAENEKAFTEEGKTEEAERAYIMREQLHKQIVEHLNKTGFTWNGQKH